MGGDVTRMSEITNAHKSFGRKNLKGRGHLEDLGLQEDNIRMDLREIG
jgi:hypothetical protein